MSDNGNKSAFATTTSVTVEIDYQAVQNMPQGSSINDIPKKQVIRTTGGLTKREYFAGLAMQGYIAAQADGNLEERAQWAVEHADALLLALEKSP